MKILDVAQFLALAAMAVILLLITLQCSGVDVMGRTLGPAEIGEIMGEDFRRVTKIIVVDPNADPTASRSFQRGQIAGTRMVLRMAGYSRDIELVDSSGTVIGGVEDGRAWVAGE